MWKLLFARLEETVFSWSGFASAFVGVVGVRLFLEILSSPTSTGALATDFSTILHYALFYFAVMLALTFVLSRCLRAPERRVLPVVLFGLTLTWIAPLIDFFGTFGKGMTMAYMFAAPWQLLGNLVSFFGPFILPGVTVGMRLEILLMTVVMFFYAKYHGRTFFQSVFVALAGYATIFFFVGLPSILSFAHDVLTFSFAKKNSAVLVWLEDVARSSFLTRSYLHPTIRLSQDRFFEVLFNVAMGQALFWISAALIGRFAWKHHAQTIRAILRNMRPARVIHYVLLLTAGFAFAVTQRHVKLDWNWLDVSTFLLTVVGFWSAWMFAVCVNDLVDEVTDQISNARRPLITGVLSHQAMKKAAAGFFGTMLLAGFLTGTYTLFFLGSFTAAYWVYSVPPLRLKRVPILSNFLVGIACLSAFLAGFYLVSADRTMGAVPFSVVVFVLIGFTLAANVKDLKDIAGDRAEGVLTIPVWLGERKARRAIGVMIALVFLMVPFVFGSILWIPSIAAAFVALAVCIESKMPERGIFALYFLYALIAFILL